MVRPLYSDAIQNVCVAYGRSRGHHDCAPCDGSSLISGISPAIKKNFSLDNDAGEKGTGRSGKPLHYKNSTFHRVIPKFMLQVRLLLTLEANSSIDDVMPQQLI